MIFAIFRVVVIVAGLGGGACSEARLMPLHRTMPIGILTGTTTEQQERAIEYGLAQRHWAILQKTPGRYVAQLLDKSFRVVVNVDYGAQGIAVNYVDSTALKYTKTDDGRELIHRRYASWVNNLLSDIRYALNNGSSIPPPPSPPPVTVMNDRGAPPGTGDEARRPADNGGPGAAAGGG